MSRNQRGAAPDGFGLNGAKNGIGRATADDVAAYLRRHPDFLTEHPDLLAILKPPARVNGHRVIDLHHYQVEHLRQEVDDVAQARDDLLRAGRCNLTAQRRVHEGVLALLGARSFENLIEIVTTDLAVLLHLDAVTLGVESTGPGLPPVRLGGVYQLDPDSVDCLIGRGRDVALRGDVECDPQVFGAAASLIASEALIRLSISSSTPPALLALGSRNAEQFHPGQGTELLSFLARTLEQCIRAWLELPD
ncbi:MAG: DUF484 family protein [Pseudomonadota bacterium]